MTRIPDIGIARITCKDRTQQLDWQIMMRVMVPSQGLTFLSYSIHPSNDVWVLRTLTPALQTETNFASVFLHIKPISANQVDEIKAQIERAGAMPPSVEDSPRDLTNEWNNRLWIAGRYGDLNQTLDLDDLDALTSDGLTDYDAIIQHIEARFAAVALDEGTAPNNPTVAPYRV